LTVVVLLAWIFFEVSEIEENDGTHEEGLVFLGGRSREGHSEVIRITKHRLEATLTLLGQMSNIVTASALDFEVDGLAWLAWGLAVHTDLAAASVDLVSEFIVFIITVDLEIHAVEGILDLAEVVASSVLNPRNINFGSIEAVASTLARSFDL